MSPEETQAESRFSCCPVCGSEEIAYTFQVCGRRLDDCSRCGLLFFNPQPSAAELSRIYSTGYLLGDTDNNLQRASALKRASAGLLLDLTSDYCGPGQVQDSKLLDVGCGSGHLLAAAQSAGFGVTGVDVSENCWTRPHITLQELNCILGLSKPLTYPMRVLTSVFSQTCWNMRRIR